MARQKPDRQERSSRVTPKKAVVGPDDGLEPLYRRNPIMFWAIVVGALAMVLSTMTGFIALLA